MENQHRKISGYRELSKEEIDLMNEIKALGPQLDTLVKKLQLHAARQTSAAQATDDKLELQRLGEAQPHRWISIGTTHLQEGLMALTRSVAQPTFF